MVEINIFPKSDAEKERFIYDSESRYTDRISYIADKIVEDRPTFLLVSGATCSGKTTTSNILSDKLSSRGYSAKIISIDDFFLNKSVTKKYGIDYESCEAIDINRFYKCIENISSLKKTNLPIFDFASGKRSGYKSYTPRKDDIIIFEGIQALYPKIRSSFPSAITKTLFLGFLDDISVGGTVFKASEVRFYRRLVRDFKFRGADVQSTLELWGNVVANENKNILPYYKNTDYFINTFFEYELFVIKHFLLNEMTFKTQRDIELYNKIKEKFASLPNIPSSFVPEHSMFREFIGE